MADPNLCKAEFMFEPDDSYYSVSFFCQSTEGHDGPHTHLIFDMETKEFIGLTWTGGNVSISDNKKIKRFKIGFWNSED